MMPFISVGTVCVLPEHHPLAARPEISVRDLFGVELILLARMRPPRQEIDRLFWQIGLQPNVRLEVHSVMSACALAARGLGVTLVNELMAQDYRHLPITIRPLKESLRHPFAFAYSDSTPISATAKEFVGIATQFILGLIDRKTSLPLIGGVEAG
jgi:DNA-binding transcriptional LysR family regulator